jgi:hypothetical protein
MRWRRHRAYGRPSRSRLARSRGRADFRNHGAAHGRSRRRPAGYPLLDRGTYVAAERNGPDVFADERLPFAALAEADLEPTKRRPPGCDPAAFGPSRPINTLIGRWQHWLASEPALSCSVRFERPESARASVSLDRPSLYCNFPSDSIEGLAPRQHLLYLEAPV